MDAAAIPTEGELEDYARLTARCLADLRGRSRVAAEDQDVIWDEALAARQSASAVARAVGVAARLSRGEFLLRLGQLRREVQALDAVARRAAQVPPGVYLFHGAQFTVVRRSAPGHTGRTYVYAEFAGEERFVPLAEHVAQEVLTAAQRGHAVPRR